MNSDGNKPSRTRKNRLEKNASRAEPTSKTFKPSRAEAIINDSASSHGSNFQKKKKIQRRFQTKIILILNIV